MRVIVAAVSPPTIRCIQFSLMTANFASPGLCSRGNRILRAPRGRIDRILRAADASCQHSPVVGEIYDTEIE